MGFRVAVLAMSVSLVAHGQPASPGQAYSIELVVDHGTAQDDIHAQYKPGSVLHLHAVIRDAAGNVISPVAGDCTPELVKDPDVAGKATVEPAPDGGYKMIFSGVGAFSVGVRCAENPQIASHDPPYRFETSTGTFAETSAETVPVAPTPVTPTPVTPTAVNPTPVTPTPIVPTPTSSKAGGSHTMSFIEILGGLALGYLAYEAIAGTSDSSSSSSDNCPSYSDISNVCPGGGVCLSTDCACPMGFHEGGCFGGTTPAGKHGCLCDATVALTSVHGHAHERGVWANGLHLLGAMLGTYSRYVRMSPWKGAHVVPWARADGAGINLFGRF